MVGSMPQKTDRLCHGDAFAQGDVFGGHDATGVIVWVLLKVKRGLGKRWWQAREQVLADFGISVQFAENVSDFVRAEVRTHQSQTVSGEVGEVICLGRERQVRVGAHGTFHGHQPQELEAFLAGRLLKGGINNCFLLAAQQAFEFVAPTFAQNFEQFTWLEHSFKLNHDSPPDTFSDSRAWFVSSTFGVDQGCAVLSVESRQHEPLSNLTVQVLSKVPYHLQTDGSNKNFLSPGF
jgi:hypothetical protein